MVMNHLDLVWNKKSGCGDTIVKTYVVEDDGESSSSKSDEIIKEESSIGNSVNNLIFSSSLYVHSQLLESNKNKENKEASSLPTNNILASHSKILNKK